VQRGEYTVGGVEAGELRREKLWVRSWEERRRGDEEMRRKEIRREEIRRKMLRKD
jgi:hypothetical protein